MKKFFIGLVLTGFVCSGYADEGMWLPLLIGQQKYNEMLKKGLKLTKEQLYSINKTSIKDAVVIFGSGCTGEIVSNEGLIFTNHHCGYKAIAAASSVEHNYLKDGFYAKEKEEEIPAGGVTVQFLLRIEDLTKIVDSLLGNLTAADRSKRQQIIIDSLNGIYSDPAQSIEAKLVPMFKSNQFLVFVYQRYKDVRLVGAPAESIGKFGGETDNWEWPRHTGDFSVFRVYASKDGKPADYSVNNIPVKPKYFLPVSIKGFKDGDYTMTYGYPGSTNRYETSYGVKLKTDVENPSLVTLRDARLKAMMEQMKKDPAVKLQLASSYASIANYWKFYDGESKQLIKYGIYEKKQAEEAKFEEWSKDKPEFSSIFTMWNKLYTTWRPFAKHRMYINEGILGSPLMAFASSLLKLENDMVKTGVSEATVKQDFEMATKAREDFMASENKASDQRILALTTMMFYTDIDKNQHPIGFYENLKSTYGDLKEEPTYSKWAKEVFSRTMLFDDAKWNAFVKNPDPRILQNDQAFAVASSFLKNWNSKYLPTFQAFTIQNNELGRLYLKGIMQMNAGKIMYPDANFTMRISYGSIKSYQPQSAIKYDYVCTMKGVLEKYKPGDYEFDLPAKLLELAGKKDFGQYIDKIRKDLVVTFITTNDITGGNSGSPVIDGTGNLIGLVFDGNYEALSHQIAYDGNLNRTICVDIRYVLWCIEKVGGAGNLIKELKIVK